MIRKVDPGYPLQIMRENVSGTVILYAVIHADGSVGNIRILRSVDDRLDRFASQAVSQWRFQPATKDGAPVDVEATFQIPFRPGREVFSVVRVRSPRESKANQMSGNPAEVAAGLIFFASSAAFLSALRGPSF